MPAVHKRNAIRPNSYNMRALVYIRDRASTTAEELAVETGLASRVSGLWVQKIQTLIDGSLVIAYDMRRDPPMLVTNIPSAMPKNKLLLTLSRMALDLVAGIDHPNNKSSKSTHAVLHEIHKRGSCTAKQLIYARRLLFGPNWFIQVQELLDAGYVSAIDSKAVISVYHVTRDTNPHDLHLSLTRSGITELHRLNDVTNTQAPPPAPKPVGAPYRTAPRFDGPTSLTDRPPVIRSGAMDFAQHPSVLGNQRTQYEPHC